MFPTLQNSPLKAPHQPSNMHVKHAPYYHRVCSTYKRVFALTNACRGQTQTRWWKRNGHPRHARLMNPNWDRFDCGSQNQRCSTPRTFKCVHPLRSNKLAYILFMQFLQCLLQCYGILLAFQKSEWGRDNRVGSNLGVFSMGGGTQWHTCMRKL